MFASITKHISGLKLEEAEPRIPEEHSPDIGKVSQKWKAINSSEVDQSEYEDQSMAETYNAPAFTIFRYLEPSAAQYNN